MPEKRKVLVLVDGSSYLYRAFHALPPLTTSKGEPTGAIHGVLNMLQKLIRDYEPEHIAVVFDAGGKTFRDEMFEEYKANRPPMPDELRSQIDPILEAVRAMGLPLLQTPGVEADDVIGTLAHWADQEKMPTIISTGDKDMAQLVNDNISLVNTMTGKSMDRNGVKEKFDVYPEQIVDFLALTGDSSDNIPGVPKVGPKTAAKWLNEYETLDNIVANADQIKGKVGESLRENLEQLELSRKLATIRCDLELVQSVQDLTPAKPDIDGLRKLYQRLEMNSLLRKLPETEEMVAVAEPIRGNYQTIFSQKDFSAWLKKLEKAKLIAFDTETDSLDYMNAQIVGLSFAIKKGEAAYVPVAHDYPGAPDQLSRDEVLAALQPLLENPAVQKVGHHLKFDAHILANYGIHMDGMKYDSMLESYVLNSTATRHDMDSVARRYLNVETISFEDVAGKGAKQLTFNQVPIEQAGPYAAEDADISLRLHLELWRQLKAVPMLCALYEKIEQPLVPVLLRMEHTGVLLDPELLRAQSAEIAVREYDRRLCVR